MDLFSGNPEQMPFAMPRSPGFDAVWAEDRRGYNITVPNGAMFYSECFFEKKVSDRCVEYFQENDSYDWKNVRWRDVEDISKICFKNINWKQDNIRLYGKTVPLPRLTAWYGDEGRNYTYSGITSKPNPWNEGLLYIRRLVEQDCGAQFNSLLLNWYRDGADHLSWHSDDERELGRNPVIASANFGAERDFVIRRKDDKSQKVVFPLRHGTLLLMSGALQHHWEHAVPKRTKISGSRFNLTFRHVA
ncbi:alpha-ketoglutarate-dependent dioxygenase AlkB [Piscinibacter sakaiensis]|uniref:alpha-ketoglutarate-dependent dioxygenase AlkB family protein n=1 Tax=Piscinibacter sakaiensis TaxID=1547922 RepID=UPI000B20FE87|nr:alpha-ketoglutarate-dependent dioxygenase AlkB [Piscinibacter sakaiensis]